MLQAQSFGQPAVLSTFRVVVGATATAPSVVLASFVGGSVHSWRRRPRSRSLSMILRVGVRIRTRRCSAVRHVPVLERRWSVRLPLSISIVIVVVVAVPFPIPLSLSFSIELSAPAIVLWSVLRTIRRLESSLLLLAGAGRDRFR